MLNKKILLSSVALLSLFTVNASAITIKIISPEEAERRDQIITREEALTAFGDVYSPLIPKSYDYINLKFNDIDEDSELGDAIQKLVYIDRFRNINGNLYPSKTLTKNQLKNFSSHILGTEINFAPDELSSKSTLGDLEDIINKYNETTKAIKQGEKSLEAFTQSEIFRDVYQTLNNEYYGAEKLDQNKLVRSAIKGLVQGAEDEYTVYFPPIDSAQFTEQVNGEFSGIGAQVEQKSAGEIYIVSPLSNSPAEKAGIMPGDQIIKVDEYDVTQETPLDLVTSWIKGPTGTNVDILIKRNGVERTITIERDIIVMEEITYKKIRSNIAYIKMMSFGPKIAGEFKSILEEIANDPNIGRIIIDVRNNPGGYLDQVQSMLGYVAPAGEPVVIVNDGKEDEKYYSRGEEVIDWNMYNVSILQNKGSASASEIFTISFKDYFPDTKIIGETSYGKGSVQTLKQYSDGSSFKYTIAKWFSGKNKIGIDGEGIKPDIIVDGDTVNGQYDPILEKAINTY